ncbi:IS1595 family transposase [Crocinitomix catalasitica]|nr:IS1595 family transposase [Crocinitomix catalasitica]
MIISEFYKMFPDEASCRKHLKTSREQAGIECKKCGSEFHYWLKAKEQWQCRKCNFRTTLRSGTLFESSNLKLKTWYEALYLVCNTKKGISACELQRQLGLKRNEPAWYMLHKIRKAMARINEKEQLSDNIELDDAFFTTVDDKSQLPPMDGKKRDRGTIRQKALVMVESANAENRSYKDKCGKIRMFAVHALDQETIWKIQDQYTARGNNIRTDGYRSYRILDTYEHELNIMPSHKADRILPWVHTAMGNIRRLLIGIYHHISSKFTQLYFDEFTFKFNYRHHKYKWKVVLQNSLNFHW